MTKSEGETDLAATDPCRARVDHWLDMAVLYCLADRWKRGNKVWRGKTMKGLFERMLVGDLEDVEHEMIMREWKFV